jgi:N utilization substance protein B
MSEKKHQNGDNVPNRRKSRELALCTLYAHEVDRNEPWEGMLDSIAENNRLGEEIKKYAAKLLDSTVKNIETIDSMIARRAENWEMRRMAAVDRNLLRIAVAELAYFKETVPFKVVIDEAVEIAKVYGTDDSGKFVNGILDSVRKDLYS